jgi:hypothetical protein
MFHSKNHMMKFKTAHFIAGAVIVTAVALPIVTMAQTPGANSFAGGRFKTHQAAASNNMIFGTVTGISGTTLTVTDAKGTVYAVDASSAKIDPGMGGAGLSIANVVIGDKVVVTGPVTGTNEAAKTISDRSMNGRNIFSGKVTAVSGSLITINSMAGKTKNTYTVDASAAVLSKGMGKGTPTTIALTDIAVGDQIFAIGTLSGTNVAATSVRDISASAAHNSKQTAKSPMAKPSNLFSGTVTGVSGSTITMTGLNKTVYTVNAATAVFTKGMGKTATTITLADIKVGDRILATGTLSGTAVNATTVRDIGQFMMKAGGTHRGPGNK